MVHGISQFTPSIAFRYVLHRCESRDIRCRESFRMHKFLNGKRRDGWEIGAARAAAERASLSFLVPWRPARGFGCREASGAPSPSPPYRRFGGLRDVAGNEPPTSPRSEHFTGPFNPERRAVCTKGVDVVNASR
ncbi:hypothetical protein K1719_024686 [Acacia pycnantha]|nr:hypothetical protein K1719_024686 [Acacia pycnantha]